MPNCPLENTCIFPPDQRRPITILPDGVTDGPVAVFVPSNAVTPPDDDDRYIFTNLLYTNVSVPLIYSGHSVNMLGLIKGDAWAPYTPEIWEELNK